LHGERHRLRTLHLMPLPRELFSLAVLPHGLGGETDRRLADVEREVDRLALPKRGRLLGNTAVRAELRAEPRGVEERRRSDRDEGVDLRVAGVGRDGFYHHAARRARLRRRFAVAGDEQESNDSCALHDPILQFRRRMTVPYRDFYYTLNVFMHVLTLEEGGVEHLHYGLFERVDEPICAAQER